MGDGESGTTLTRPDGKHVVTVNSRESIERQRFTVCHEIAHVILGLPSSHDGVPSWSYAKRHPNEIACDWFAGELLMPHKQWLAAVPKATIARRDRLHGRRVQVLLSRRRVAAV